MELGFILLFIIIMYVLEKRESDENDIKDLP